MCVLAGAGKLASFHNSTVALERKGKGITRISVFVCVCIGSWTPCPGNNLSHITESTEVCGSGELSDKIELTTKAS